MGSIDFAYLEARCDELLDADGVDASARTDDDRAALAGIPIRTYYRYQSGETSPSLRRLALIAAKLGTTTFRLQGMKP